MAEQEALEAEAFAHISVLAQKHVSPVLGDEWRIPVIEYFGDDFQVQCNQSLQNQAQNTLSIYRRKVGEGFSKEAAREITLMQTLSFEQLLMLAAHDTDKPSPWESIGASSRDVVDALASKTIATRAKLEQDLVGNNLARPVALYTRRPSGDLRAGIAALTRFQGELLAISVPQIDHNPGRRR